jgi:hypothetical protein
MSRKGFRANADNLLALLARRATGRRKNGASLWTGEIFYFSLHCDFLTAIVVKTYASSAKRDPRIRHLSH